MKKSIIGLLLGSSVSLIFLNTFYAIIVIGLATTAYFIFRKKK